MAMNLFRKDALEGPALIKGLALRTMGNLRVEKLNEYISEPIKICLKDPDPYVRKTAVLCVIKLYELSASLVESLNMIQQLQDMCRYYIYHIN